VCPGFEDPAQEDADGDGKGDRCDNCVDTPNPDQLDQDLDQRGDACDECPLVFTRAPAPDLDGDGIGDPCDDGLTVHGGGASLSCATAPGGVGWPLVAVLVGGLLRRRRR
jgi:uncharacterized protein (TIGR03382 family)